MAKRKPVRSKKARLVEESVLTIYIICLFWVVFGLLEIYFPIFSIFTFGAIIPATILAIMLWSLLSFTLPIKNLV